MSTLDWTVLFVYLTGIVVLGYWVGRNNRKLDDFFLAGLDVDRGCAHLAGALLEGFELRQIVNFDLRQCRGMLAQDRIEVRFGNPQPSFPIAMQPQDGIVWQLRRTGLVKCLEAHPIEAREALEGSHPEKAIGRLGDAGGRALGHPVLRFPMGQEEILLAADRRGHSGQGWEGDQAGGDDQEQRQ